MKTSLDQTAAGEIVAALLAGSWRQAAPPLPSGAGGLLPAILGLTLAGGAAALLARRLQKPARGPGAQVLQRARRHALAQADCRLENLQTLVRELYADNLIPLLVKGWAVARLYPEPALRPFDDFDVCVRPERFDAAAQALGKLSRTDIARLVDLHAGLPDLDDRPWTELWRRTRYVKCGAVPVRVLGAEDQLRHLALHFWRHLGCRPIWLCDIGAALESIPADFDWDYLLNGTPARTDRMLCVLALAKELLGAEVSHPAVLRRAETLPTWLPEAVLWRWGAGSALPGLAHYLRRPREFPSAVRNRWLNPLRAVSRLGIGVRRSYSLIQLQALLLRPKEAWRRLCRGLAPRPDEGRLFAVHEEQVF
jgi:hypothetical protein